MLENVGNDSSRTALRGLGHLQPVNLSVMRKFEYKLVNDAVDSDGSADELIFCICRVLEDEMLPIEFCEI